MTHVVGISPIRLFSILIVAACTTAALAAPGTIQTSTQAPEVITNFAGGPGTPMPILPTTKGGFTSGTSLIAGPGTPMPILPTTKGGFTCGSILS